jgi:hypothetical protein
MISKLKEIGCAQKEMEGKPKAVVIMSKDRTSPSKEMGGEPKEILVKS